jgi:hypothetical protein
MAVSGSTRCKLDAATDRICSDHVKEDDLHRDLKQFTSAFCTGSRKARPEALALIKAATQLCGNEKCTYIINEGQCRLAYVE